MFIRCDCSLREMASLAKKEMKPFFFGYPCMPVHVDDEFAVRSARMQGEKHGLNLP
jgi:hypothetical protein